MRRPILLLAAAASASMSYSRADPAPALARAPVIAAASAAARQELGKPVRLKLRRFAVQDRWAFLFAALRAPDGAPIDYAGTPKADAAAHGMASKDYAALLSKSDQGWSVVADALGPTDMPWETWPQAYGAPKSLFDQKGR
jgi:hypothetical protein